MWGRVVEMATAVWLALSPFIFRSQHDVGVLWIDLSLSALMLLLSGLSYWKATRYAYLGNLAVAMLLILIGRFSGQVPPDPAHQNHIFVGFFLMMIAVIPNSASRPPMAWRRPVRDA